MSDTPPLGDEPDRSPEFVTTRELTRNPGRVVAHLREAQKPIVVTNNGKPIAALLPINELAWRVVQDYTFLNTPESRSAMARADQDLDLQNAVIEWSEDTRDKGRPRRLASHEGARGVPSAPVAASATVERDPFYSGKSRPGVAVVPRAPAPALASRPIIREADSPAFLVAKVQIHNELLLRYGDEIDRSDQDHLRKRILELTAEHLRSSPPSKTRIDIERLADSILDDVVGTLGPLESLLADPDVTEILADHGGEIFVEKHGKLQLSTLSFASDVQMRRVIDRILGLAGRHINESSPVADVVLGDGSRVNAIIPPAAVLGPSLSIRKVSTEYWGPADLVNRFRSASPEMMAFLRSCVRARLNIVISGGTNSGKTTLLNVLSSFIQESDRIAVCEERFPELRLLQPHVIQLVAHRSEQADESVGPSLADLIRNCLRMRPDRVIVGEVRSIDAVELLHAMNAGFDGSMCTVNASDLYECLVRLESLLLKAGNELPLQIVRESISSAIHLVVHLARLRGGVRRIVSVAEITGIKGGELQLQEVFTFRQVGINDHGDATGYHTATGAIPTKLGHLHAKGEDLSDAVFVPTKEPTPDRLY